MCSAGDTVTNRQIRHAGLTPGQDRDNVCDVVPALIRHWMCRWPGMPLWHSSHNVDVRLPDGPTDRQPIMRISWG